MSGKIYVIADERTYLAFALAGMAGQVVRSGAEAQEALQNLPSEVSLVLITESLAEENRLLVDNILLRPGGPLIVEIPDYKGPRPRAGITERIAALLKG